MDKVFTDFLTARVAAQKALNQRCHQPENFVSDDYFLETLELGKAVLHLGNKEVAKAAGRYAKTVGSWYQSPPSNMEKFKVLDLFAKRTGRPLPQRTFEAEVLNYSGDSEDTQGSLDTSEPAAGSSGE